MENGSDDFRLDWLLSRFKGEYAYLTSLITPMVVVYLLVFSIGCQMEPIGKDWLVYKADSHSSSYSELDQINKQNVDQLEVAWTYRTGDLKKEGYSTIETNPVIVDGVLYGGSPFLQVFALDAETGRELWTFQPFPDTPPRGYMRGVTYWKEGQDKRIFFSAGNYLFSLDATTGQLIEGFGDKGRINMNEGLGRDTSTISVKSPSPGIIYKDLIIMGSATGEGYGSAPGHIRAYDVRSGEMDWIFHTIPKTGQPGYETWHNANGKPIKKGGVNNWAGMSLDEERGIVYIPLGSTTYDFYGGDRLGKNLYGNSLLALDAATGEYIWHYQTVHHDLWDYDLPAPPNLVTIERNGKKIDAVVQVTKTGFTFVLNRVTGEPLFEIKEQPVPQSNIPSEKSWPTQPHPLLPEPFIRQNFTRDQITDLSAEAHDSVLAKFKKHRNEGFFTPPDPKGTISFPSTSGGANWGGAAFDPETGILYINANEIPEISTVRKVKQEITTNGSLFNKGKVFYNQRCSMCHGSNLEGQHPMFPPLNNVDKRLSKQEVLTIVEEGGGRMPALTNITEEEKEALIAFLYGKKNAIMEVSNEKTDREGSKAERFINVTAYKNFEDPNGYPAIKPPWGSLNAINLNTGKIKWKIPLGTYPTLLKKGLPPTGTKTYGGPMVTEGGLVFIGGTEDKNFHAFDKDTGKLLWKTTLPTGGFATPATYLVYGRQYVVIAVGGGRGTKPGDYYVAFRLPK